LRYWSNEAQAGDNGTTGAATSAAATARATSATVRSRVTPDRMQHAPSPGSKALHKTLDPGCQLRAMSFARKQKTRTAGASGRNCFITISRSRRFEE
jgi:hypothetical protein